MAEPRPAKDLEFNDERSRLLRKLKQDKTKALADEMRKKARQQAADSNPRKAKDLDARRTKTDARAKFLRDAKQGNIRAATPRPSGSGFGDLAKGVAGKGLAAAGFYFGDTFGKGDLNRGEREFMADIKKKAGKGYGDKPVGPFKPTNSGKTFDKGKGSAALPKSKEYLTKTGVTGGAGAQGYGRGTSGNYVLGANASERKVFSGDRSAPKPKVKPERLAVETVRKAEGPRAAVDKSRISGTKKSFSGNWSGAAPARAPKSLAEATRRGQSDEYMKRNRPKGNLLEVIKTKVSIGLAPKKNVAPVNKSKSVLAAQFRAKMQGRAK